MHIKEETVQRHTLAVMVDNEPGIDCWSGLAAPPETGEPSAGPVTSIVLNLLGQAVRGRLGLSLRGPLVDELLAGP